MKTPIAIALVVFGIIVLAYSGLSFSTPGQPIQILGLHIATSDNHFIPPAMGALMLAGGLFLFFVRPKQI